MNHQNPDSPFYGKTVLNQIMTYMTYPSYECKKGKRKSYSPLNTDLPIREFHIILYRWDYVILEIILRFRNIV